MAGIQENYGTRAEDKGRFAYQQASCCVPSRLCHRHREAFSWVPNHSRSGDEIGQSQDPQVASQASSQNSLAAAPTTFSLQIDRSAVSEGRFVVRNPPHEQWRQHPHLHPEGQHDFLAYPSQESPYDTSLVFNPEAPQAFQGAYGDKDCQGTQLGFSMDTTSNHAGSLSGFNGINGIHSDPWSIVNPRNQGQINLNVEVTLPMTQTCPIAGIQSRIRQCTPELDQYMPSSANNRPYSFAAGDAGLNPGVQTNVRRSVPSSSNSTASSCSPSVQRCGECGIEFIGQYGKGNLRRHQRQKHRNKTVMEYPCEIDCCNKTFKRKDARLKHYRNHHQHLGLGPAVPRRPQRTGRSSKPLLESAREA